MGMKNRLCIELHYVMTEASTSSDNLVKPKGANSAVWTYFGVEKMKEKRGRKLLCSVGCARKRYQRKVATHQTQLHILDPSPVTTHTVNKKHQHQQAEQKGWRKFKRFFPATFTAYHAEISAEVRPQRQKVEEFDRRCDKLFGKGHDADYSVEKEGFRQLLATFDRNMS